MTDETKKLFVAPYSVVSIFPGYDIITSERKELFAHAYTEENANRLARLPELYDALIEACGEYCPELKHDINHCDNCGGENCKATKWVELLKKVRDGE